MSAQRYLAVDVGERRTGVAATDATGTICIPLERLDHAGMAVLPDLLEPLLRERATEVLVVGVPLDREGNAGPQAQKVLALVERMRARFTGIEVVTVDEAATTDAAHRLLKDAGIKAARRKRYADSIAALEILRRYLGAY